MVEKVYGHINDYEASLLQGIKPYLYVVRIRFVNLILRFNYIFNDSYSKKKLCIDLNAYGGSC
jgi:hypothetical protein